MKYYFLVTLLLFAYKTARADEANGKYEVRFLPGYVGYSNYSGVLLGGSAAIAINMGKRWQWEWGAFGGVSTRQGRSDFSVFTGPRFNLSEDRTRSWFVGLGVEYGDRWQCCDDDKQMSGYMEVGKRFRITESWTYSPSATFQTDGDYSTLSVRPATFTYSF